MAERVIEIVIKGKNLTGADFAAARKELRELEGGSKEAAASGMSLGSAFKVAGAAVAGIFTAQAIMRGVGSAFSFAKGAAFDMNATLEKSTLQFATLMGDTKRAEQHVRDLFQFAKATPFETGPIIEASRHMQTFGGDSLNTMENLGLLGDAAAATGAPIDQLGFWVGRMYAAMKGGQPFGEATMRLMEMGVLTPQVRAQMEALSESAGGGEKAFALFKDSIGGFSGAMVSQANTWEGLMSSISDAINITLADALKPFFDTAKSGAQMLLQVLGSEGTQRVFDDLKNSLTGAFGGDGQGMVKGLAGGLLTFASGAVTVADTVGRAFSFVKMVFAGTASVFGALMIAVSDGILQSVEMAEKIPGIGSKFQGVAAEARLMRAALHTSQQGFHDMAAEAWEGVKGNSAFSQTMSASKTAIEGLRGELSKATVTTNDSTTALRGAGKAQEEVTVLTKEQKAELVKSHKVLADFNAEVDKQNAGFARGMATIGDFTKAIEVYTDRVSKGIIGNALARKAHEDELDKLVRERTMSRYDFEIDAVTRWAAEEKLVIDKSVGNWRETVDAIDSVAKERKATLLRNNKELQDAMLLFPGLPAEFMVGMSVAGTVASKTFVEKMSGALQSVPGTLARAFEGGGDWLGAAKSIGSQFGSVIGDNIGSSMKALGALGGPLGAALGSLAGPLVGKIAGLFTSKNTQEVKAYNVEIGKVFSTLYDTYGTLDQLEAKAQSVGLSFRDNIGQQGKAGLEAVSNLAAEFKKRWDGLNESIATSNTELDTLIKKGADLGYVFDQQGNLVGVTFDKVKSKAAEFGVSLEGLGPTMRQQMIDEEAARIINGFELMEKAGADVGGILVGMKDEIGKVVGDSVKFGTTVPENMRPWIKNLIDTGQLIDDNGVAITDMSAIKFGAPVQSEFDQISSAIKSVVDKLAALIDTLNRSLTPAIDSATRDRTIRIGFEVDEPPDLGGDGWEGARRHATGTMGVYGVDFPDFGRGTRAILDNREAVVPYEQRFEFAQRVLSGGAASRTHTIAPTATPSVYIINDMKGARQVSEDEFRQIQARIDQGLITVPSRSITQRPGR